MTIFLMLVLILVAVFMILLVLVQRGRGGGLAGALGGAGGQSAFGAKAGDTFTKITVWAAFIWILLCVVTVKVVSSSAEEDPFSKRTNPAGLNPGPGVTTPPATGTPATGTPATGTPAAPGATETPATPAAPAAPSTPAPATTTGDGAGS